MLNNTSDPLDIVKEKGWLRITDKAQLKLLCNELIEKNLQKVSKNLLLASHALIVVFTTQAKAVQTGDSKLFKWFIGQAMGRTRGMADSNTLNQVLSNALGWSSYEEMMSSVEEKSKENKKK